MPKLLLTLTVCLLWHPGFGDGVGTEGPEDDPQYFDITEKDMHFTLFTRKFPNTGVSLVNGDKVKLLASGFKGHLPTKVCTHGYMSHGAVGFILEMKGEFLKKEEVNVISIDWSACAKNLRYDLVVVCMKKAGRYTGEFLQFLQREGKLKLDKTHLIGHSLGAQMFAFTALGDNTIGRITGLDPAGPLFEHAPETGRLNPNSAKFVDVIHTCRFFVGMARPIGTVDFYPNGGFNQPGCGKFDLHCHHHSSTRYFIQTIRESKKYVGTKCKTLQDAVDGTCNGESGIMGYDSYKSSPGMYYLKTSNK